MTTLAKPVHHDRRLYFFASVTAAFITVLGFSRTYYLRSAFHPEPLSGFFHVHGAVMTLWFAVFITQVLFVAKRRIDLHRNLGWAATVLSVLVVVLGYAAAIDAARRGRSEHELPPLVFMMIPLSIMTIFAVLTGMAIFYRRRSDIHKRLMLLASLNMLTPAIARIPAFEAGGPGAYIGSTVLIVLACVAYDTVKNRKLHPVYGWGAGLLILSFPLRIAVAKTAAWQLLAAWLIA